MALKETVGFCKEMGDWVGVWIFPRMLGQYFCCVHKEKEGSVPELRSINLWPKFVMSAGCTSLSSFICGFIYSSYGAFKPRGALVYCSLQSYEPENHPTSRNHHLIYHLQIDPQWTSMWHYGTGFVLMDVGKKNKDAHKDSFVLPVFGTLILAWTWKSYLPFPDCRSTINEPLMWCVYECSTCVGVRVPAPYFINQISVQMH